VTILAGIVSRSPSQPVPANLCAALAPLMSRFQGDQLREFRGPSWYLAKVNIGAFDGAAAYEDDHAASMLAGEPLLLSGGADQSCSRDRDLLELHRGISARDDSPLKQATGTFCGVHYDKTRGAITLYTDKFGVRPIYYWIGEQFVVYASALRILEGMALVPKVFDLRGVSEVASFGFPLAERTPYLGIATLRAGELVNVVGPDRTCSEYWRWDHIDAPQLRGAELAEDAHSRFIAAVGRRVGSSKECVAFLSGGLDSRAIVAALRELGTEVHTLNFAPLQTQDEVFGREAARALQTSHHHLAKPAQSVLRKDQVYNQQIVTRWFDEKESAGHLPMKRIVWSGDGGSVGLGHVYLTDRIVALAQAGQIESAIGEFLSRNKIATATKLFRPEVRDRVSNIPRLGMKEELARLQCADAGRALHLFLMFNDQRRHMADVYENIDISRLEFQLPFFDSDFMSLIIGNPINQFLKHEFYLQWLKACFPMSVSVPWQAYPGHAPCTLPVPTGLRYQWTDYYEESTERHMRRAGFEKVNRMLKSPHFPDKLMSRWRLRAAEWSTRLKIGNYAYIFDAADKYTKYWNVCETHRLTASQS
jgi:asparagine synthase (glutamine-hydrolysing)